MKKLMLFAMLLSASLVVAAQDKIKKHDGETLTVKVIRVTESSIVFRYEGEEAEQLLGRLAVKEITYSSGRKEQISEKIVVSSKDDWEKVQIVEDKAMIAGLKKGDEIRGKTSGIMGFHTANTADRKAMRKLMEAAAEAGAPFVLITSDKDARSQSIGLGSAQGVKRGFMYFYN
ncbi:MAG: hypothetical protein MUF62_10210 [Chitinophagaceae bacterium]|nr:hypothetical protein [Chitinophagaceae bacterium]